MIQEHWLLHFCEKDEKKQLLQWLNEEGLGRPREFEDRVAHAEKLKRMFKEWYDQNDFRRALHCIMGAVHALDFMPSEQLSHSEEQRNRASQLMLPIMSNAAMVFLKRGDFNNAAIAASAGLRCSKKLPEEETKDIRKLLLYRRGLARGEKGPARDLEGARSDLTEAARLDPNNREIRKCLDNCKALAKKEEKESPLRYGGPKSAKKDDAVGDEGEDKVAEKKEPKELSPFAEKFAEIVGRCLGRTIRRFKKIRQGSKQMPLMPMVVTLILIPTVGLAIHFTSGLLYPPGAA